MTTPLSRKRTTHATGSLANRAATKPGGCHRRLDSLSCGIRVNDTTGQLKRFVHYLQRHKNLCADVAGKSPAPCGLAISSQ